MGPSDNPHDPKTTESTIRIGLVAYKRYVSNLNSSEFLSLFAHLKKDHDEQDAKIRIT